MSTWQLTASLVIPDGERLLMLEGDAGWYLPSLSVSSFMIGFHLINRDILAQYHAKMTLLRIIKRTTDEEREIAHAWWLMENHTEDWTPPANGRWFDKNELATLSLAKEDDRAVLLEVLISFTQAKPNLRPMFMQNGWFSAMQQWVSDTLVELGYTLLRPPEQFKQFILTAIIRAETEQGDFYAKVANPNYPLFCDEAHTMQALTTMFPETIPAPLAIHPENGLAIFSDFGKSLWEQDTTQAHYERIAEHYAEIQIKTSTQVPELEKAGCINRRLDVLKDAIDTLLSDDYAIANLNEKMREQWLASGDRLKSLVEQLTTYNLPYTLVHGDFHGGNMSIDGERITIFDWTDACIAHPFFDIATFADFNETHALAIRDAYLACWVDYEPMERLLEAYDIAYILSALHQFTSYQSIYKHGEASYRDYFNWSVPHFVGVIVEKLVALDTVD